MTTTTNTTTLTIEQADEIILNASTTNDGAIEDCEETTTEFSYFFESGAVGTVNRMTGSVAVKR